MILFLQLILAFLTAAIIVSLELITSQYPRTFMFVFKHWGVYVYAVIYGLIAFFSRLILGQLITSGDIQLSGIGISDPWVQSIVVGVSVKAFCQITLLTVKAGTESVPIGIKTITNIFEKWLLDTIERDNFSSVMTYLEPFLKRYTDLNVIKKNIISKIPAKLKKEEIVAFSQDINLADEAVKAMELGLNFLGKNIFEIALPLK